MASSDIQAYLFAVDAFNRGDLEPLGALIADDCDWTDVGTSREGIMKGLTAARDAGWARHDVLSITSEGELMIALARNTLTDGSTFLVGGCFHINKDGKYAFIRSLEAR